MHRFSMFPSIWTIIIMTFYVYQFSSCITFNVGNCTAEGYYEEVQRCKFTFFQRVRGSRRSVAPNCSDEYTVLRSCVKKVYLKCIEKSRLYSGANNSDRQVENMLSILGDENKWCKRGGLEVPKFHYVTTSCSSVYYYAVRNCPISYNKLFQHGPKARLCNAYKKANKCLINNLVRYCTFHEDVIHAIKKIVVMEYNFQPFCPPSTKKIQTQSTYMQIKAESLMCPQSAQADVMFLLDVSGNTTDEEFISMKNTMKLVAKKLNYFMDGIRISFAQFHHKIKISIEMNRYMTLNCFLRGLSKTNRIRANPDNQRLTGKALIDLANNELNIGKESCVIRPFHAPLCIVLSTGQSSDSIVETAVQDLTSKQVHVVRIGPHLSDKNRGDNKHDVTYNLENTTNFESKCDNITNEICQACKEYSECANGKIKEAEQGPRIPDHTQLPYFWEQKPIEPVKFSLQSVNCPTPANDLYSSYGFFEVFGDISES